MNAIPNDFNVSLMYNNLYKSPSGPRFHITFSFVVWLDGSGNTVEYVNKYAADVIRWYLLKAESYLGFVDIKIRHAGPELFEATFIADTDDPMRDFGEKIEEYATLGDGYMVSIGRKPYRLHGAVQDLFFERLDQQDGGRSGNKRSVRTKRVTRK
jgi:hypothetical protein